MEPTPRRKMILSPIQSRVSKTRLLVALGVGVGIVGLLLGWYLLWGTTGVVPKKIQRSVDFTIYYPGALPPGYALDTQSFRLAEQPGVVIFSISHGNSKKIFFSEQDQLPNSDMDKFINTNLPLNSEVSLPLGNAKFGAYGSAPNIQTVVSLPIRNGPWVIVNAPSNTSHDDLVKILTTLTK